MALERETVLDLLTIDEAGGISVRVATYIKDGADRIAGPQFHRAVYGAGEDLPDTIEIPNVGAFALGAAVLARAAEAQVVDRLTALAVRLAE